MQGASLLSYIFWKALRMPKKNSSTKNSTCNFNYNEIYKQNSARNPNFMLKFSIWIIRQILGHFKKHISNMKCFKLSKNLWHKISTLSDKSGQKDFLKVAWHLLLIFPVICSPAYRRLHYFVPFRPQPVEDTSQNLPNECARWHLE